jgi:hypothetical protein
VGLCQERDFAADVEGHGFRVRLTRIAHSGLRLARTKPYGFFLTLLFPMVKPKPR